MSFCGEHALNPPTRAKARPATQAEGPCLLRPDLQQDEVSGELSGRGLPAS